MLSFPSVFTQNFQSPVSLEAGDADTHSTPVSL